MKTSVELLTPEHRRSSTLSRQQQQLDQGRRQVKICGVDRHGERGARAYNGSLEAERPDRLPYPYPRKNSSDLYQFQERPLAKVGWKCPPQSTEPDARQAISSYNSWRTMASRYCVVVIGGTACSRGDVIPPAVVVRRFN